MELKNRIFEIFMIGGDFVLYLLIAMSVLSVAIFIERCVVFWRIKSNLKEIDKNNILLLAQKRLSILATFGNNAPFIGLFGTVLGVIRAFHDLSVNEGFGIKVVMGGISESLVATAMGLLVAIPAVIAYNYFITKLKTMLLEKEIHETA